MRYAVTAGLVGVALGLGWLLGSPSPAARICPPPIPMTEFEALHD